MVDHRMSLKDRAKQWLRMCGHALTSTVHDRMDVLERELRIAKLVETNTALLEASIHVVENLHALAGRTIVETEPSEVSVEASLMAFLYSHVPSRLAICIAGSDRERTEALLRAGYEVYGLEAGKVAIAGINGGMSHLEGASGVARASGVAGVSGGTGVKVDTLIGNSVGVNPLDVPEPIALIALGCEALPAARKLGDRRASVVTADLESDFEELAGEMRSREYHWHIVLYRTHEGDARHDAVDVAERNGNREIDYTDSNGSHPRDNVGMSYYANHSRVLPNSRGTVFFFREYRVFTEAQAWCAASLPLTYFKPRQA
jgi:hypothetical protein